MATRTFNSLSFNQMSAMLTAGVLPEIRKARMESVPFSTSTPEAAVKHSEPCTIVACHFNEATREIRAVGDDTNVRICKIDRLQSIEHARTLWKILQGATNEGTLITFMAAGGFNPDRWFFDISKA